MSITPSRWHHIEPHLHLGTTRHQWRQLLGECYSAVEPTLRGTQTLASLWPAPEPGRPPLRVVELAPDRFVVVCDGGYTDDMQLTRSDVVLYRLDERLLRKAVCAALDLRTSNAPVGTLPGALQLGSHDIGLSLGVPVWLLGQQREHGILANLEEFRGPDCPVIVVLWSDRMLTSAALAFDTPPLMMTTLDQVLVITAKGFEATEVWHARLAAFRKAAKLAPQTSRHKKTSMARNGKTYGTAGKLKEALRGWYRAAQDHLEDKGELLEPPTLESLESECGISDSTVYRWLEGCYKERDRELKALWQSATDRDQVRRFHG